MIQRRLNKIKLLGSTPTTTASVPANSDDENDGDSDDASDNNASVSSNHHSIDSSNNGNVDNEIKQG